MSQRDEFVAAYMKHSKGGGGRQFTKTAPRDAGGWTRKDYIRNGWREVSPHRWRPPGRTQPPKSFTGPSSRQVA